MITNLIFLTFSINNIILQNVGRNICCALSNRIHSACLHCNKPSLTRSLYTATKTPANSGKQPPDSPRGVTLAAKCLNVFVK